MLKQNFFYFANFGLQKRARFSFDAQLLKCLAKIFQFSILFVYQFFTLFKKILNYGKKFRENIHTMDEYASTHCSKAELARKCLKKILCSTSCFLSVFISISYLRIVVGYYCTSCIFQTAEADNFSRRLLCALSCTLSISECVDSGVKRWIHISLIILIRWSKSALQLILAKHSTEPQKSF